MLRFFKVGETAYFRNLANHPHLNGMEVYVIGGLRYRRFLDKATGKMVRGIRYRVKLVDRPYEEHVYNVRHKNLTRKKRPNDARERNTAVSWDDCAWKPKQTTTTD